MESNVDVFACPCMFDCPASDDHRVHILVGQQFAVI
jgi:hypothetical protein